MNRRIAGISAGLVLLSGCGEPAPMEVTPTEAPAPEAFNQLPLLDKPLLQIGSVIVICAGIEGLNQPFTDNGCTDAAKTVSEGFRDIAEATKDAIPLPTITTINIQTPLKVEGVGDRCSQHELVSNGFTDRVLKAAVAVPEVKKILNQTPDSAPHIVSESPVAKTCGDPVNRVQGRYMRGQPGSPVVQFSGEGKANDVATAAHEHLHRRLGHVVRLVYPNKKYYTGEALDGTEYFTEAIHPGPTIMGDRAADPYLLAFQQLQLGIITPGQVAMPTAAGEVVLESPQIKGEGQRILTLPLHHPKLLARPSFIGVERPRYWFEHTGGNEIAVLAAGESPEGRQPDEPALVALLHAGQPRFTDKTSGFSVTLKQINEAQAKLEVTRPN